MAGRTPTGSLKGESSCENRAAGTHHTDVPWVRLYIRRWLWMARTFPECIPRGASFEAFVIDQLVSAYGRVAPGSQAYFWRTAQGDEVDLLVDLGSRRVPFEMKLHSAPGRDDVPGLRRCLRDLDLPREYVLYPGRERYSLGDGVFALPAEATLARPRALTRREAVRAEPTSAPARRAAAAPGRARAAPPGTSRPPTRCRPGGAGSARRRASRAPGW